VKILDILANGAQSDSYMNEADPNESDWQQKLFEHEIYNRLKSIKETVDPDGLSVCKKCVGSDGWSTDCNFPKTSNIGQINRTTLFLLIIEILLFII
jgi:hypothetical protein